jgi:hypothetical protein
MARLRTLKPSFFTSEEVCRCQPLARLLFQGLWCEADRNGLLEDKPLQLKMRLLPADDCDVDALLWELEAATLIRRVVTTEGQPVIVITAFHVHQRPHPKEAESTISVAGASDRTRPEPWYSTAGREKVNVHPGEHPSSSRRVPSDPDPDPDRSTGSARAGAPAPPASRTHPRQAYGASLVQPRNLGAAFEGPIFDIPSSWARRAVRESAGRLTDTDITAFGSWLTAKCDREGAGRPAEKKLLAWLDDELMAWEASQRDKADGDALYARSREWDRRMQADIAEANRRD